MSEEYTINSPPLKGIMYLFVHMKGNVDVVWRMQKQSLREYFKCYLLSHFRTPLLIEVVVNVGKVADTPPQIPTSKIYEGIQQTHHLAHMHALNEYYTNWNI